MISCDLFSLIWSKGWYNPDKPISLPILNNQTGSVEHIHHSYRCLVFVFLNSYECFTSLWVSLIHEVDGPYSSFPLKIPTLDDLHPVDFSDFHLFDVFILMLASVPHKNGTLKISFFLSCGFIVHVGCGCHDIRSGNKVQNMLVTRIRIDSWVKSRIMSVNVYGTTMKFQLSFEGQISSFAFFPRKGYKKVGTFSLASTISY